MVLLNSSHQAEFSSQLRESLFLCGLRESDVHVCPLVVLPASGSSQILCCAADALQLLEPHLGMFLLVVCRLQKQGCDLLKALLLGLGSKIGILVPSLGLARESGLQILLGLCACVLGHFYILLNPFSILAKSSLKPLKRRLRFLLCVDIKNDSNSP